MEYKEYLEQKNFTNSSIESHQRAVKRFNNWIEKQKLTINQITYNDITAYIKHLQKKGNKQRTVQIEIGTLKHYLNYQKSLGELSVNPIGQIKIQGVKRQQLYTILKEEELEYIYQSYPSEEINLQQQPLAPIQKRNRIILGLLVYQGLTTTDLANIKVEHVKLHRGTIEVPETKKSNSRILKLEPHQAIELQHFILVEREQLLIESSKDTQQLIFSTGTANKINNLLQTFIGKINQDIPKVKSIKQIRTSVITKWLKQHNLRETQYRAGHKFVSSTEKYKVNDIETLENDITKFSPSI